MPNAPICLKCAAPLALRGGKLPKFCPKCGEPSSIETASKPSNTVATPVPTIHPQQVAESKRISQTTTASAYTQSLQTPSPETQEREFQQREFEEIASWRWNWGAFLVPGVWLLAHRIKPKIVALVLLGLPLVSCLIGTTISIATALSAENSAAQGINLGFGAKPADCWNSATYPSGFLLGFYILACIFSIPVARKATLDAWRAFPNQRLDSFKQAQRFWAVGGLLLFGLLIYINIYVGQRYQFWAYQQWQPSQSNAIAPMPPAPLPLPPIPPQQVR